MMRMNKQSGSTSVEFALVLIFFFTFFLGIVDFARMLWTWHAATEATRWGARVSVVCAKGAPAVLASMKKFLPQLTADNLNINWYNAAGAINNACTVSTNVAPCAGVSVSITALNFKWISPVGFAIPATRLMPGFSTYLPRESMGQDANSSAVCS